MDGKIRLSCSWSRAWEGPVPSGMLFLMQSVVDKDVGRVVYGFHL